MRSISILFVCLGNLCRSPTAQAVFRQRVAQAGLTQQVRIASAGTHASPKSEPPDRRAQSVARQRGYVLSDLRSRRLAASDFVAFDLLLAMDADNLADLRRACPPGQLHRVHCLTDFSLHGDCSAIPDPYYGNTQGFERVLTLIEEACDGLLLHVRRQLESA